MGQRRTPAYDNGVKKMEILDNLRVRRSLKLHDGEIKFYTTNMHWPDLYEALGLDPKKHLPADGLAPQRIGNVMVWIDAKIPGKAQDGKRVWCLCPHCDKKKVLTAGKLHQHMKVHRRGDDPISI
jgi:hypothetical protein